MRKIPPISIGCVKIIRSFCISLFVRWCLPSKGVFLQFCKVLSAFWITWVQQDLTVLTISWKPGWLFHLDSLDQKLFNEDFDGFHLFGEILAFNLWWSVSKVTCPDKCSHYFFLQFFSSHSQPFCKCGSILKHTHIFSSDNIWMRLGRAWTKPHKVNGKIPMVSVVFGWGYYYANSRGCLA